jgi:hypothetical protein
VKNDDEKHNVVKDDDGKRNVAKDDDEKHNEAKNDDGKRAPEYKHFLYSEPHLRKCQSVQ